MYAKHGLNRQTVELVLRKLVYEGDLVMYRIKNLYGNIGTGSSSFLIIEFWN